MVDKHIKELGVDGYGVRACEGNLVNLLNILEACRKNLCVQIVCSENVNDFKLAASTLQEMLCFLKSSTISSTT